MQEEPAGHAELCRLVGGVAGWSSRATRRARTLQGSETLRPSRPGHASTVHCASLSIRAPGGLAAELARDQGREDEAVEQREQHEQVHVRREGLHAQRHHAPARAQRVPADGVMRRVRSIDPKLRGESEAGEGSADGEIQL